MMRAARFIGIGIVGSLGCVRFGEGLSLPSLVYSMGIFGRSRRCGQSDLFVLLESRVWRRRCLLGSEIVNTIDRRRLVICNASPLSAITWFAHPRGKLTSLCDVGHAMRLEQIEVGSGVVGDVC